MDGDGKDEMTSAEKKDTVIFDSTATDAIETLAAGMQSGLTSPSRLLRASSERITA